MFSQFSKVALSVALVEALEELYFIQEPMEALEEEAAEEVILVLLWVE